MIKQIIASAIALASFVMGSAANASMRDGCDFNGQQCYHYSAPRPDPNAYAQAGSVGGYSPYGYGGMSIVAPAGAKVDYHAGLLSGTDLGVNKSCEKVGHGNVICTKPDGSQYEVKKDGTIVPVS